MMASHHDRHVTKFLAGILCDSNRLPVSLYDDRDIIIYKTSLPSEKHPAQFDNDTLLDNEGVPATRARLGDVVQWNQGHSRARDHS